MPLSQGLANEFYEWSHSGLGPQTLWLLASSAKLSQEMLNAYNQQLQTLGHLLDSCSALT